MKKLLLIIFLFLINFNFASAETQFDDDGWKQKQSYEDGVSKYVKSNEDAYYYCKLDNFRETECMRLSSIHLNDITICPHQYLSSCSQKLAVKNKDVSFCEYVQEPRYKFACYRDVGMNKSLTTEKRMEACIKAGEAKGICITSLAISINDPEICSILETDFEKQACLARLADQPKIIEQAEKGSGRTEAAPGEDGFYKLYGTYTLFFAILVALLFIFLKPFEIIKYITKQKMNETPTESGLKPESTNLELIGWSVLFAVVYIGLNLIANPIFKALAPIELFQLKAKSISLFGNVFINWYFTALLPYLIFIFGYFISHKTQSYKKILLIAILLLLGFLMIPLGFSMIPLGFLMIPLGFFVGREIQTNNIGRAKKITFLVLLFLLITIGSNFFGLTELSPIFFLIGAPYIVGFLGYSSLIFVHWVSLTYYSLFLYFTLVKRKWILPTVLHLAISAFMFYMLWQFS